MNELDPSMDMDEYWMSEALRLARRAGREGEVPIGALVVRDGEILGRAWNQVEMLRDATAHAEMLCLTQAQAALGDWRLEGCDLYVTKEPCPMCAGALVHCRIRRVIFGARDEKGGACGGFWNLVQAENLNHRCEIRPGVLEVESVAQLKSFFQLRREAKKKGESWFKPGLGQASSEPPEDHGTI